MSTAVLLTRSKHVPANLIDICPIVRLAKRDLSQLPDADWYLFVDSPQNVKKEDISLLIAALENGAEFAAGASPSDGFFARLDSLVYAVGGGQKAFPSTTIVGFAKEHLPLLKKSPRFIAVGLMLEAIYASLSVEKVLLSEKRRDSLPGLIADYLRLFDASQTLKYIFSSVVAFVIDFLLLLYLDAVLPVASMEIGALIAWMASSISNFFLNRNYVFRSSAPLLLALTEYYSLAGVVFLLKTYVLLELLIRVVGIPLGIAKPVAEVVFFVTNYFIQKKLIFKKR